MNRGVVSMRRWGRRKRHESVRLARALGWFSIGLGVSELVLGGRLSRALGMGTYDTAPVVRTMGLREVATGVAILIAPKHAAGLWARVAGDLIDLGGLWSGLAMPSNPRRGRVALAMGAVAGVTALDYIAARQLGRRAAA